MKTLILAGGYGSRLEPKIKELLNEGYGSILQKFMGSIAKPLMPINEKPLIEYLIESINLFEDVDQIYVVTNNYYHEQFLEWNQNYKSKKLIKILNDGTNSNEDRLGATGDVKFTIDKENIEDDLFLVAGDNLFDFDLLKLHTQFHSKSNSFIAAYDLQDKNKLANKFGVLKLDLNDKIINFEEKPSHPKSSLAATAIYMLKQRDVSLLKSFFNDKQKFDNMGEMIKYLVNHSNVFAQTYDSGWYDIGSSKDYEDAVAHMKKMKLAFKSNN